MRAPTTMVGYWNRPDATAEVLVDGWLDSGDAMPLGPAGKTDRTTLKRMAEAEAQAHVTAD